MINFETAQKVFKEFLKDFDVEQDKVRLKIIHTYHVVDFAEYIAKDLKLSNEDIELAKLIGLLHDIGRFDQAKRYNDFRDMNTLDHAELGVKILFKENKIRDFIKDDKYDSIIYKAILNHNKLKIEDGLNEKELLHAKIIRDADKADNFRVKQEEKVETMLYMESLEKIENGIITDKIYEDFMNSKIIKNEERVTALDYWVSYIAFLYDFNFNSGLKYVMEQDYINRNIDKINYKNPETRKRMENVRQHALEYVSKRIA